MINDEFLGSDLGFFTRNLCPFVLFGLNFQCQDSMDWRIGISAREMAGE